MESLSLDPGLMAWTVITFALLMFLLGRFAFKPLVKLLKERESSIQDSLDRAEKLKVEAAEIMARNESQIDAAMEEARGIIAEGQRIVAEMRKEAEAAAKREAEHIVERARSEADREFRDSLDELKSVVANLSVRISRQVIRENLDEDRHRKLADDLIDRMKKINVARQR